MSRNRQGERGSQSEGVKDMERWLKHEAPLKNPAYDIASKVNLWELCYHNRNFMGQMSFNMQQQNTTKFKTSTSIN